jgi:hypothetical protein
MGWARGESFHEVKEYLKKMPMFVPLKPEEGLLLYVDTIGTVVNTMLSVDRQLDKANVHNCLFTSSTIFSKMHKFSTLRSRRCCIR